MMNTQRAALNSVDCATLQHLCLSVLMTGAFTADEIAYRIGKSVLAVRPRISVLHKAGVVADTGERHLNVSGKPAAVWGLR